MSFTLQEQADILRFCGYGPRGAVAGGFSAYRFFTSYGLLEFRMANMQTVEEGIVRTTYLANLATLETGVLGAAANLNTDVAAVWTRNRTEVRDRLALLDEWRRRLCSFMGVPAGPYLQAATGRMVV